MYIDRYEISVRRAEIQKLLILRHPCMHLASIRSTAIDRILYSHQLNW